MDLLDSYMAKGVELDVYVEASSDVQADSATAESALDVHLGMEYPLELEEGMAEVEEQDNPVL